MMCEEQKNCDRLRIKKVIITFNRKFVPEERNSPFIYGAVQHVIHISDVLYDAGIEVIFLLYNRDPELRQPNIDRCRILGYDASIISFNFDMESEELVSAFSGEIRFLSGNEPDTITYSQSIAIADYFDTSIPLIVTNHSPFVRSVYSVVGEQKGRQAFDWDHPKADFLLERQGEALENLALRTNVTFAEISKIQIDYLRDQNIENSRIFEFPPAIECKSSPNPELLPDQILELGVSNNEKYVLFPVSRFDYFKDVEFFLEGVQKLIVAGQITAVILIGGENEDSVFSDIEKKLDPSFRKSITRLPRLSHDVLIQSVFPWIARHGLVACTSRYDLVPYTMLEAIVAGAKIVVPRNGYVGSAEFVPAAWTYERNHEAFRQAVLYASPQDEVDYVQSYVSDRISRENILKTFISAALYSAGEII